MALRYHVSHSLMPFNIIIHFNFKKKNIVPNTSVNGCQAFENFDRNLYHLCQLPRSCNITVYHVSHARIFFIVSIHIKFERKKSIFAFASKLPRLEQYYVDSWFLFSVIFIHFNMGSQFLLRMLLRSQNKPLSRKYSNNDK